MLLLSLPTNAALSVDLSRIIFNEGDKSVGLTVKNNNLRDPYLAQGWMENEKEEKIHSPFMVLPPVQRVEAGGKTKVRVQTVSNTAPLPTDRESVFWFNLREIPPKSDRANVLMLAMQIRLKVFYRPAALKVDPSADTVPGTDTLSLIRQNDQYVISNPTPYHFSFVEARNSLSSKGIENFEPFMVAPGNKVTLSISATRLGNNPVLTFVNDYGSQRLLPFSCSNNRCKAGKPHIAPDIPSNTTARSEAMNADGTPNSSSNKNHSGGDV